MARRIRRRSFAAAPREHGKRVPIDIEAAEKFFRKTNEAVKAQKCALALQSFAMANQAVARARSEAHYASSVDPRSYSLERAETGAMYAMEGCLKNWKLEGLGAHRRRRR